MSYIGVIAIICALVFLIRIQMLRRQMKNIVIQLEDYRLGKKEMKVAISLTDRLLETLTGEINRLIDREIEAQASKLRVERELKEAISGMSHDLRTPLTAIIGYMQLVEQPNISEEERKEYLSIAMQRALRLQQLIENFFSLSIVEADDYPLKMEQIQLTQVIKDMLLSYYDQFQEKKEQPIINIQESIFIYADLIACKRVIENVILNVIQHAEGAISISLLADEFNEETIFTVQNKVDNEYIHTDRLFNRFYTADQTRRYSGGLGLVIVKNLMEKLNGTVDIQVTDGIFEIVCKWRTILD